MRSLVILLALCATGVFGLQRSYEGFKVYSVSAFTKNDLEILKQWENVNGVDFWDQIGVGKGMRIMVPPIVGIQFENFLQEKNFEYTLLIDNVENTFESERKELVEAKARHLLKKASGKASVDFDTFWDNDRINEYLDEIAATPGSIATVENIGTSYEGRPLRAVKIAKNGNFGDHPIIFVDAGVHAREWAAIMVGMSWVHELVSHPDEHADILDNVHWLIIPNVNPDGYVFSHTDNRLWRKTRSPNEGSTCVGVDGNRNYAYQWQLSTNPCSDAFSGPAPFSESEIAAVRDQLHAYSNIALYLSLHTYGNYLLYPWGYDFINIDNWEQHDALARDVAAAILPFNGRVYSVGNSAELLYTAFGASDDYAAGPAAIPLAFTVELPGGGTYGFDLPASALPGVVEETLAAMTVYGRYVATN